MLVMLNYGANGIGCAVRAGSLKIAAKGPAKCFNSSNYSSSMRRAQCTGMPVQRTMPRGHPRIARKFLLKEQESLIRLSKDGTPETPENEFVRKVGARVPSFNTTLIVKTNRVD